MNKPHDRNLEVDLTIEGSRAVIDGKTSVPFKTFVSLILQRKVLNLLRNSGENPIILDSELLTNLASAPQDSQENRTQLVLVTLGTGILTGIFGFSVAQAILLWSNIQLTMEHYLLLAGTLVGLTFLVAILDRMRKRPRGSNITEAMEQLASLLSK
jgi:H+/Cl- antiporter ClcA